MGDLARVAVLLAAYNGMKWIEEQVDSILKQINADVSVYISVDYSSDETYEWCLARSALDKRVTILPYGRVFGGAGPNFYRLIMDVDLSGFDYVALADQDDIWIKDKLQYSIDELISKKADAFSSDVTAFWSSGKEIVIRKSQPQVKYDYLFEGAGPGCSFVLTAESFEGFKKFLEDSPPALEFLLHDWLIYAYYRANGLTWFISNIPKMLYRQHASNQVGFNHGIKAYKARISEVKSGQYRNEISKLISILGCPRGFRFSRAYLLCNVFSLRRRFRDALVLFAFIFLGLF